MSGALAYSYPEVGSHSVMMRCSKSCMDWFVPVPEKMAQVQAGMVYCSNSSVGVVLETAI